MRPRPSTLLTALAVTGTVLATASLAAPALASSGDGGSAQLVRVSHDPYQGDGAQHATEAEPDTFAHGKTVVSVFQTGRFGDGGSTNTGWATSTDSGTTWKHGFLPGQQRQALRQGVDRLRQLRDEPSLRQLLHRGRPHVER